jgi:hypothetical protein
VVVQRLHEPSGGSRARNAPMTPRGRIIMIERIEAGRPIAHVAAEMHQICTPARHYCVLHVGPEDEDATPKNPWA